MDELLRRLGGGCRRGSGYMARCPAHDDRRASLSIKAGNDGRTLLYCHAGCEAEAIVAAMGFTMADLFPAQSKGKKQHRPSAESDVWPTPDAYATYLAQRERGSVGGIWTYRDSSGAPSLAVVRIDIAKDKTCRPLYRVDGGWCVGDPPGALPIYRLPEVHAAVRDDKLVWIAEGEKCAEALVAVGYEATTSSHGAKSAAKSDWSPLAGADVLLCPDNDKAGAQYAEDVGRLLRGLNPPARVRLLRLPDLPDRGDIVDFVAARRAAGLDDAAIRSELDRLIETAPEVSAELRADGDSNDPDARETPLRWRPFPVHVLPEPAASFVREAARALGCDSAYVALALLAALAGAIGNSRRTRLKRTWPEPAILWVAIIGESGTLKTPAFKLVLRMIRKLQRAAFKQYERDIEAYERDLQEFDAAEAAWKRAAAKCDGKAGDPPKRPDPPVCRRYLVRDITVEALALILRDNPRGVVLFRDELAGWILGFEAYKAKGRGGDAQNWLSMHSGEGITVDRKSSGPKIIDVPSAAVSVMGGIQPGILRRVMTPEHRESGLLARLFIAQPPRRPKKWTDAELPVAVELAMQTVLERLYDLQFNKDEEGDPQPIDVPLTPAAKAAWVKFHDEHADEQVRLSGELSAAWSKLEGGCARLALIIHFVRWAYCDPTLADPDAIDEQSMASAIALARWFAHEARRLYATFSESEIERSRRELMELIERRGGAITPRDLQRSSRRFAKADKAEQALSDLVNTGIGTWELIPPGPKGGKPSRRFRLAGMACADETARQCMSEGSGADKTPRQTPIAKGIVNVNGVSTYRALGSNSDGSRDVGSSVLELDGDQELADPLQSLDEPEVGLLVSPACSVAAADTTLIDQRADTADVDETPAGDAMVRGIVNVGAVNRPLEAGIVSAEDEDSRLSVQEPDNRTGDSNPDQSQWDEQLIAEARDAASILGEVIPGITSPKRRSAS